LASQTGDPDHSLPELTDHLPASVAEAFFDLRNEMKEEAQAGWLYISVITYLIFLSFNRSAVVRASGFYN